MNISMDLEKIKENIKLNRIYLHRIPEVGLVLPKTAEYIKSVLDNMGIEYEELHGVSGIVATIIGNEEGRTIGIRGDMDALPIEEKTGLPFASTNGAMHACGHDGHMAILLEIARVLNENKDMLKGQVKLIFQPGEEGFGGAEKMIDEGILEKHPIDCIISHHIGSIFEEVENGQIAVGYGTIMSCLDKFSLTIYGKGGHGAQPHKTVDPILISSEIIQAIQSIVSREIDTSENAVISIGKIHGGTAHNIIPDSVEIEGTVRTTSEEVRLYIMKRIEEIAKGITIAMRGNYDYNYYLGYPVVRNNDEMVDRLLSSARKIFSEEEIAVLRKPTMIGEDIAYFLNRVPGVYFFLGSKKEIDGVHYPHHHCKFDIDEEVLYKGVLATVQFILDVME